MNIQARVRLTQGEEKLKGYADITLDGCFAVHGIRLMEGRKGVFVMMPARKSNKDAGYQDICFPVTKEFREKLNQLLLAEYHAELAKVGQPT